MEMRHVIAGKFSWLFVYFVVKKISQLRFNELAIPSVEAATLQIFRVFRAFRGQKKGLQAPAHAKPFRVVRG